MSGSGCRRDVAAQLTPWMSDRPSPVAKQNSNPKRLKSGTPHKMQDTTNRSGVVFDEKPSCTIFAFTDPLLLVFVEI